MKIVYWRCDNACGREVYGDVHPGWLLIQVTNTLTWTLCSWHCAAEFAIKAENGVPMGQSVSVVAA